VHQLVIKEGSRYWKFRFTAAVGIFVLVTDGPGVIVTLYYAVLSKGCSGVRGKVTKMRRDK